MDKVKHAKYCPFPFTTTQGKPSKTPFCHNKQQNVQDNCRKHRQSMKAIFDRHTISSISVQIAAIPDVRENIDPPTMRGDGEVGLWRTYRDFFLTGIQVKIAANQRAPIEKIWKPSWQFTTM